MSHVTAARVLVNSKTLLLVLALTFVGCECPYSRSARPALPALAIERKQPLKTISEGFVVQVGERFEIEWTTDRNALNTPAYVIDDSRSVIERSEKYLRETNHQIAITKVTVSNPNHADPRRPWKGPVEVTGYVQTKQIICLRPLVIAVVEEPIELVPEAAVQLNDPSGEGMREARVLLPHGYAWGGQFPYQSQVLWFAPDNSVGFLKPKSGEGYHEIQLWVQDFCRHMNVYLQKDSESWKIWAAHPEEQLP